MKDKTILYVHGMGGSGHDGFHSGLVDHLSAGNYDDGVMVKLWTLDYDFDPEKAQEQIAEAIESSKPDLIVTPSLGAFHTQMFPDIPRVLISPALNAGKVIAQVGEELQRHPLKRFSLEMSLSNTKGNQVLTANPKILKKFQALAARIDRNIENLKNCPAYAVYGANDMYMQMNVVNPKHSEAVFNSKNYDILPSLDHNFNGFDVIGYIMPKIREFLGIN